MNAQRLITRNERRERVKAETIRRVYLIKDKGRNCYYSMLYDRDMWDALMLMRRKAVKDSRDGITGNVTDPKRAQEIEDALAKEQDSRAEAARNTREDIAKMAQEGSKDSESEEDDLG
jgi:hypothetical protein